MRSVVLALILYGHYVYTVLGKSFFASPIAAIFTKKPPKKHEPYDTVAQFLLRFGQESDMEEYTENEISHALRSLAKSQSALKTMDGVTHQFRNVLKESSSLQSRFEKLLSSKRKKLKEAAKVYEYTRTVERGLQSAEIIQSVSVKNASTRSKYLSEAGLVEVKRVAVLVNKVRCVVSVLVPKDNDTDNGVISKQNNSTADPTRLPNTIETTTNAAQFASKGPRSKEQHTITASPRFHPREVVVCITEEPSRESTNIAHMLRLATRPDQKTTYVLEEERNGDSSELMMQSTYVALAHKVLDAVQDVISQEVAVSANETNLSGNDTTVNKQLLHSGENDDQVKINHIGSATPPTTPAATEKKSILVRKYDRVRVIGHSAGGAVAALTSLILDGGVFASSTIAVKADSHIHGTTAENGNSAEAVSESLDALQTATTAATTGYATTIPTSRASRAPLPWSHPLTSLYAQRVQCMALGPPPCMSRVIVPKYITSVVCGDDLIPRAQAGALLGLQKRVSKALKAGAGTGSLGYMLSAGVLKDLSALTRQNLGHYKGKKSTSDLRELCVPGRVFFVKPRRLKEGATVQRVMRGNWQEDMLWQLKEILLSKRMLEHHSLDSYIRTLNRC